MMLMPRPNVEALKLVATQRVLRPFVCVDVEFVLKGRAKVKAMLLPQTRQKRLNKK
jgi:hypothetical protein